jgi:hypothetical protein
VRNTRKSSASVPETIEKRAEARISLGSFIEVLGGLAVGLIAQFYLENVSLATMSYLIGPALSISRYLLTHSIFGKLDADLDDVHALARTTDLLRKRGTSELSDLLNSYLSVTEPAFAKLKSLVVSQASESLHQLADAKRSGQLNTPAYYSWLLPELEEAQPGSRIWAVSMMLDCEWDDSPEEEKFLDLNLEAVRRGVLLDRVFVVSKQNVQEMLRNRAVQAQLRLCGAGLSPFIVFCEDLERRDAGFLHSLGAGFIAFDGNDREILVDQHSPDGIRGYVTRNPHELLVLERRFGELKNFARLLTPEYVAQLLSPSGESKPHFLASSDLQEATPVSSLPSTTIETN